MRKAVAILVMLSMGPFSALAANVTTFQGGRTEEVAWLEGPDCTGYINLSLSAECRVENAVMDVSSVLPDVNCSNCPEGVQVFLNDRLLWEFNGADFGALGRQDAFQYGMKVWKAGFDPTGGSSFNAIRLMKNATALNATMQIQCSGAGGFGKLANLTGEPSGDMFGRSVSDAGDVNRDGYDDFIVGAPRTGNWAGKAYVFFGGPHMDNSPDVLLSESTPQDPTISFSFDVSGAGDVNGDGYDDLVVGASNAGNGAGKAYIYFGGKNMDNTADVIIPAPAGSTEFGFSVHGAGDLNDDGFDDVVIGTDISDFSKEGQAYVYYGAQEMDNVPDVNLPGSGPHDLFGTAVSGAGDVNNDGYDDVIVGAYGSNGGVGAAYVFYGGANMDNTSDIALAAPAGGSANFGYSVSGLGDVNGDEFDDVIVGTMGDSDTGNAYIWHGGANMSSSPDVTFAGERVKDGFGYSVSGAGNFTGDGHNDVIVGAPRYDNGALTDSGKAYLYFGGGDMNELGDMNVSGTLKEHNLGVTVSGAGDVDKDGSEELIIGGFRNSDWGGYAHVYKFAVGVILYPYVSMDKQTIWNVMGNACGTFTPLNFASILNNYLRTAAPSGYDEFGEPFVDVPITMGADSKGNISISKLDIIYRYKKTTFNFADRLNDYISANREDKDADGNVTVPIKVVSRTPGRVKLLGLSIGLDDAPRLVQRIPDVRLAEDTARTDLADIRGYFRDDYDAQDLLNLSIASSTNESLVKVGIVGNQYLSADATVGPGNWTGQASVIVRCTDAQNHSRTSNEFKVIVFNVNDPPVVTSSPPKEAVAGIEYTYQVVAVDGDNDSLTYNLTKRPVNMTIDSNSGHIRWIPAVGGYYEVNIEVSDGQARNYQKYIITVGFRPPRITDTAVPGARTGVQYIYDVPAVSDDGWDLDFELLSPIEGMAVDGSSGRLTWIPKDAGDFPVSVNISDGKTWTIYNFTIHVVRGNRAPKFLSEPVKATYVGIPYFYEARALDEDNDSVSFSLDESPPGMTIGSSSGNIGWTPTAAGNQTVRIKAADGKGGEAFQEFTIQVLERVKATIQFTTPPEGQKVKGKLAVTGKATKGTLAVDSVQLRVDSGEWTNATGNSTWTFTLDTAKLKNGKHTLQARAYDGMDYSEVASRTVTVDNSEPGGKGFIPGFGAIPLVIAAAALLVLRRKMK